MTLAACEIDTVGSPVVDAAGGFWPALTFDSSRAGLGRPLVGDGAALGLVAAALVGALVAADVAAALEDTAGAWVSGLTGVAAALVGAPGVAAALVGATAAGLGGTAVAGALVVGAAGATEVTEVTGGGGGGVSTDCGVCGGASTLWVGGACGARTWDGGGASTCSDADAFGAGAAVVVVVTWSVVGLANAGVMPPVSAVSEITAPDASTTTALRVEQVLSGAPMCASLLLPGRRGGFAPLLQDPSLIRRNCYIGSRFTPWSG